MIANRIKELRQNKNLRQEDIAKIIKINRATYAGYEKERTEPNAEVLARLAVYYDVSLDYLCGLTDNKYGRYSVEEKQKKEQAEIDILQNQINELQEKINNLK